MTQLDPITIQEFPARHGFFTRLGGISTDNYHSLNCGAGSRDNAESVRENRRRVAAHFGVSQLVSPYQCHGTDAIFIDEQYQFSNRPQADGMVTRLKGVGLGVLSADCAPILFIDPLNHIIAACHAGWRGALAGIIHNTLKLMVAKGAQKSSIHAALGPMIRVQSYQVGMDFYQAFGQESQGNHQYFTQTDTEKFHFDLPKFVRGKIADFGITHIYDCGYDTYSNHDLFFSNRYNTHHGLGDYGRLVSVISL